MISKFKIGDIIASIRFPENQYQIVDIIENSEKSIKGDWISGIKENCVKPNSYIIKDLETNEIDWGFIKYIDIISRLVEDNLQQQEDHQGMIYNPITDTWKWL